MARAPRLFPASTLTACALLFSGCMSLPLHDINILGGSRMLDQSEWEPVDSEAMVGIEVDTYKPRSGIGAELGFQYARDDGETEIANQGPADVKGRNYEFYAGARKTFPLFEDHIFPYLSMGVAYVLTDFDVSLPSGSAGDSDGSFGVYIRGGAYWNFASNWHVGIDLRRLIGTEVNLLDVSSDADYFQVAMFIGFAF